MKVNKKLITLILAGTLAAVALTACGNTQEEPETDVEGVTQTAVVETAEEAASENAEETIAEEAGKEAGQNETAEGMTRTSKFQVTLPQGWKAFHQIDVFGEQDENGDYPYDETCLYLSREAITEEELLTKPAVYVKYYDKDAEVADSKNWYEKVKDLDAEVQGNKCFEAFRGNSLMTEGYVHDVLGFKSDNATFSIVIPYSINGETTGMAYDSDDIQTILNSLKAIQ